MSVAVPARVKLLRNLRRVGRMVWLRLEDFTQIFEPFTQYIVRLFSQFGQAGCFFLSFHLPTVRNGVTMAATVHDQGTKLGACILIGCKTNALLSNLRALDARNDNRISIVRAAFCASVESVGTPYRVRYSRGGHADARRSREEFWSQKS